MGNIKQELAKILLDERLTRNLEDSEANLLVQWLVGELETSFRENPSKENIQKASCTLLAKGRAIAKILELWGQKSMIRNAVQLMATEKLDLCIPDPKTSTMELLESMIIYLRDARPEPVVQLQKQAA